MSRAFHILRRVGIWIDQGFALILCGSPDVTLSALAWARGEIQGRRRWRILRRVIDGAFWFEPEHCRVAWEAEATLEQWPPDLRALALAELRRCEHGR